MNKLSLQELHSQTPIQDYKLELKNCEDRKSRGVSKLTTMQINTRTMKRQAEALEFLDKKTDLTLEYLSKILLLLEGKTKDSNELKQMFEGCKP